MNNRHVALKMSFLAAGFVVAALAPVFARERHIHHSHDSAAASSTEAGAGKGAKSDQRARRERNERVKSKTVRAPSTEGTVGKAGNPLKSPDNETVNTPVIPISPHSGSSADKGRDMNAHSRVKFSPKVAARATSVPITRNAIGIPASKPSASRGSGIANPDAPALQHSSVAAAGNPVGVVRMNPTVIRTSVNSGAIDARTLIRPSTAAPILGGQAKTTGGINGTNFPHKY